MSLLSRIEDELIIKPKNPSGHATISPTPMAMANEPPFTSSYMPQQARYQPKHLPRSAVPDSTHTMNQTSPLTIPRSRGRRPSWHCAFKSSVARFRKEKGLLLSKSKSKSKKTDLMNATSSQRYFLHEAVFPPPVSLSRACLPIARRAVASGA